MGSRCRWLFRPPFSLQPYCSILFLELRPGRGEVRKLDEAPEASKPSPIQSYSKVPRHPTNHPADEWTGSERICGLFAIHTSDNFNKEPQIAVDVCNGLCLRYAVFCVPEFENVHPASALLDILVLCPGIHRQQSAPELNNGEHPAVAALTSGYVFRVENPATVLFLQKMGVTGHLTYLRVTSTSALKTNGKLGRTLDAVFPKLALSSISTIPYLLAPIASLAVLAVLIVARDWWGVSALVALIFARFCNVLIIRRRSTIGWKGASEPGVQGDLLILLSQDRWIRLQGAVDDLKAVTSGQWLRDCSFIEDSVTAFATLLVYTDVALVSNVSKSGQILILALFVFSTALLACANAMTSELYMHGRRISAMGKSIKYARRLDLANELIRETKRDDWALRLGMIVRQSRDASTSTTDGAGYTMAKRY
ncbi:conserved hypothetical protein [Histoplasma capsulatum G186AR]|uniref:Uncharacterized protein n=1 Tax=Ajellomyces capsulatus (strain G186AR / H82 / ATCC MYA-2454 / RMSCC 2432) TaxID=447093 RepID=C0NZ39_AJECG|nr:uncharacterized protein HCBG_08419 [Histoplasma capsulatum G186AR]EEH03479.1 conserved hypothetical protein [Histoplasma capsulatum G186AR]